MQACIFEARCHMSVWATLEDADALSVVRTLLGNALHIFLFLFPLSSSLA